MLDNVPVENKRIDLVLHAVQAHIMCHHVQHLQLIRDPQRLFELTALSNCQPNNAASGTDLQSAEIQPGVSHMIDDNQERRAEF
jgi:hypothetical protein